MRRANEIWHYECIVTPIDYRGQPLSVVPVSVTIQSAMNLMKFMDPYSLVVAQQVE